MSNLTATPGWDDVPQIEVTTPLLGGPGGPMNDPAQALMNRTELLQARHVADYAALRALTADVKDVFVTGYLVTSAPSPITGYFVRDDSDTTSADNGGTVIVAANGKRWKRVFDGAPDLRWFGAPCDGVGNDAAALQTVIDTGARLIKAQGLTLRLNGVVNIASNQTIDFTGSTIYVPGSSGIRLSAVAKNDWNIIGPFSMTGDGVTAGSVIAIYVSDCARWRIESPTVTSVRGWAIFRDGGTNTTTRSDHGVISNPKIKACYRGYEDQAGTGAEYVTIHNPHITECADFGLKTAAGNVMALGGHIVDNVQDGLIVTNGSNHAHGAFIGTNINHNPRYNLWTQQVTNGQSFIGCHIYADDNAGHGAIFLDRSKGIVFDGGHLDCWVYNDKDGSSGQNVIRNMYCPGGYGDVKLLGGPNPGQDQLWFDNCTGPGAYTAGVSINDPSPVYVRAQRDIASTQAISGATALKFPAETFDRRNAYDSSTGTFTVPAGQAGVYSIDANLIFSGTALAATSSYVELKINGASRALYLLTPFGTTILTGDVAYEDYLNAGDAITILATISGTSPTFGNATWLSALSIKRKS